jgi:hypothetical protein
MRLGQMARKLSITPSEIIRLLASHNIILDDNANTRLETTQIDIILKEFAPEMIQQPTVESPQAPTELPESSFQDNVVAAEVVPEAQSPSTEEQAEVIKAPRIPLSGLKVLGKIDLPEPKKKEGDPLAAEEDMAPSRERKNNLTGKRQGRDQRNYKNPVTLQREEEMKEESERRKEKAAQDKERKTQNYLSKVKTSPSTKAVRLFFDEPVIEVEKEVVREEPKSLWARLVGWLRT